MPLLFGVKQGRRFKYIGWTAKKRCPECQREIDIGTCAIVETVRADDGLGRDPGPTMVGQPKGMKRLQSFFWVPHLTGSRYADVHARWQCPNASCGALLPRRFEELDLTTIALVGGTQASKTHYVAALIKALWVDAKLAHYGCTVYELDGESARRYTNEMYRPMFDQHTALEPTAAKSAIRPLVFVLEFRHPYRMWGMFERIRTRAVALTFYDARGEQYISEDDRRRYLRYAYHASAHIILVDPMMLRVATTTALRAEYDRLRENGVMVPDPQRHPATIMASLVGDARDYGLLRQTENWDALAALTLAKCDLLEGVGGGSLPSGEELFRGDIDFSRGYDAASAHERSEKIQDWIEKVDNPKLSQAATLFKKTSFHAVSATGKSPDEHGNFVGGVEPRRCLDPLMWILYELGLISETPSAATQSVIHDARLQRRRGARAKARSRHQRGGSTFHGRPDATTVRHLDWHNRPTAPKQPFQSTDDADSASGDD